MPVSEVRACVLEVRRGAGTTLERASELLGVTLEVSGDDPAMDELALLVPRVALDPLAMTPVSVNDLTVSSDGRVLEGPQLPFPVSHDVDGGVPRPGGVDDATREQDGLRLNPDAVEETIDLGRALGVAGEGPHGLGLFVAQLGRSVGDHLVASLAESEQVRRAAVHHDVVAVDETDVRSSGFADARVARRALPAVLD